MNDTTADFDGIEDEPIRPLAERAQEAQDNLGWTDMDDAHAMGSATVEVARIVTKLAQTVARLERELAELKENQ